MSADIFKKPFPAFRPFVRQVQCFLLNLSTQNSGLSSLATRKLPARWVSWAKFYNKVRSAFVIRVNGSFRPHKSDICFTGDQSSQNFICTKARHQCQIQTFLCKISLFDCHILRRIENRMRYFIQCNLRKLLLFSIFSSQQILPSAVPSPPEPLLLPVRSIFYFSCRYSF